MVFFFRQLIERSLASLPLESETFSVVDNMLFLVLLDSELDTDLLNELYLVARCRACRLFYLLQLNRTIRELLYMIIDQPSSTESQSVMLRIYSNYCGCQLLA